MKRLVVCCFLISCTLFITGKTEALGHPLTSSIFKCQREIVQRGIGGEDGVVQAYDSLDDMLYNKYSTFKLAGIYRDCLEYLFSEEPQGVMERKDYYALISDLAGDEAAAGDQVQKKLFILMAGLRDNVAKCVSVTAGAMYALIFGPVANTSFGVCNNLEGEIYSKMAVGLGLNLGFGANAVVFVDNQLSVFPDESGDIGQLLLKVTDSIAEELFDYDEISDAEWPEFFNTNIYVTTSLGLGPVYPLSFLAEGIGDEASMENKMENCLGGIIKLVDKNQDFDLSLREFGECVLGTRGVAVGAGINIALTFDFPLHVKAPFVHVNHVLYDVIYWNVSQDEFNLVVARTDMVAGLTNLP